MRVCVQSVEELDSIYITQVHRYGKERIAYNLPGKPTRIDQIKMELYLEITKINMVSLAFSSQTFLPLSFSCSLSLSPSSKMPHKNYKQKNVRGNKSTKEIRATSALFTHAKLIRASMWWR